MSADPIYVKQLQLGPMQNFQYLIGDPETREAVVVDPGWEGDAILEAAGADGYRLTKIFVTHHHFDHVSAIGKLLAAADLPVYVNRHDAPLLEIEPGSIRLLEDGDALDIGRIRAKAMHTPGHTPGSQCLLVDGRVFSGDTLFIRACGRWDLPGGDPRALHQSLMEKVGRLDAATILYPGHNYADKPTSTIGEEKQTNPFLQVPEVERFLRMIGEA
jgi:glyoxylase-like metal-dependent hydrolase (beta-lactamase superfamily II)